MALFYIYPDNPERSLGGAPIDYYKINPNKGWARHTYNRVVLEHIASATKDAREKLQAEKEIEVADRKRAWHERHPNFNWASAVHELHSTYGIKTAVPARPRRTSK